MKTDEFIHDNLKIIIIAIVALIAVIIGATALSIAFGTETTRSLTMTDISGNVVIIRGEKQFYARKNTVLRSGDVINTAENSTVRVRIDAGKYIAVEPNSSVYVYYTGVSDKGEVSVNISGGAVICQLNEALKKNEKFRVLTPNAAVNVRGTVFRVDFSLEEKYMGYENVMLTRVQDFDGQVMLQLYSKQGEQVDEQMLLAEGTRAEMISADTFSQYNYLNYDINIYDLEEITIKELIKISGEKALVYSLEDLNSAFRAISMQGNTSASILPQTEETQDTAQTSVTTAPPNIPSETAVTENEPAQTAETKPPSQSIAPGTTLETHIYTTFPGPKWWEILNPSPDPWDEYDIDDYFDDYETSENEEED